MNTQKKVSQIKNESTLLLNIANDQILLNKNEPLFISGDEVTSLYIVQSGKIMIHKPTADGREFAIRICKQGDIIGEMAFFSSHMKHILHATALESSKVALLTKEKIPHLLMNESKLMMYLLNEIAKNSIRDQAKLRDLVMYGKRGALYATLIRLANSYGERRGNRIFITISLTNQDLANFCGTSRESINRLLSNLRKQEVITTKNNHISILDLEFLKKAIHCEDCPIDICSIH